MYEIETRIRYSETDTSGYLTIPAMINLLQDCSTFHSEDTGFGVQYLFEKKMGWFIMTWHIKMERMPRMGETVHVSTWASAYRGILATRNFAITDKTGEALITVTSYWVLMNLEKLMPLRIPEPMKEAYGIEKPLPGTWGGRKLTEWDNLKESYAFTVQAQLLDSNQHMNNEKYIEAAEKCLNTEKKIHTIAVEYRKQAVLDDQVIVYVAEQENQMQVVLKSTADEVYAIVEFS